MKKKGKQTKKFGIRRTKLKQEARKKHESEPIRPVLYTRHLKTNKHKKLKKIATPLAVNSEDGTTNLDPLDDDEQKPPASFREMMWLKQNMESKRPFRLDPDVGDTKGMKKFQPTKPPKIGKKESEEAFSRRMERAAQEELLKVKLSKKANAPLANPETYKPKKAKKSLKRLAEKKFIKKQFRHEKRLTGFEHLVDNVKFGEVVQAPPVLKTMPKKVGGKGGGGGGGGESGPEPLSLDQ
ncbi:unnamed protein product [Dibothriocephalus latus]|uniref:Uncharacterized protein n=1 Tax=Dibothriocephalus latus TaxID=60516 RepID=A0A3P7PMT5_DIBLA|nr:unnamed protein product [Dibothriocephalus latus]